jgi:hypothetical protein
MPGMERKDLIEKNAEGWLLFLYRVLTSYNCILLFFSSSNSDRSLHPHSHPNPNPNSSPPFLFTILFPSFLPFSNFLFPSF